MGSIHKVLFDYVNPKGLWFFQQLTIVGNLVNVVRELCVHAYCVVCVLCVGVCGEVWGVVYVCVGRCGREIEVIFLS